MASRVVGCETLTAEVLGPGVDGTKAILHTIGLIRLLAWYKQRHIQPEQVLYRTNKHSRATLSRISVQRASSRRPRRHCILHQHPDILKIFQESRQSHITDFTVGSFSSQRLWNQQSEVDSLGGLSQVVEEMRGCVFLLKKFNPGANVCAAWQRGYVHESRESV